MATVTERNLVRAERQVQALAEKHVVEPVWAQSFNISDSTDDDISPLFSDDSSQGISRLA